jgi:hypothetical protein
MVGLRNIWYPIEELPPDGVDVAVPVAPAAATTS